jgi:hypothetical protein
MLETSAAPVLTREQRRLLLSALDLIPALNDPVGRDLLLLDLPDGAIRAPIKSVDLGHMVQAAEAWGVLNDGMPALLVLLQNALDLSQGSMAGRILQMLYDLLAAQPAMPPAAAAPMIATGFAMLEASREDPPAAPVDDAPEAPGPDRPVPCPTPAARRVRRPSFEQQIERYIALDQAIAGERWDDAARLAARLGGFRDVDQRQAAITAGWTRREAARQALGYAYADRDWAAVIRYAPAAGPEVPKKIAQWIAHAWRMVPLPVQAVAGHQGAIHALALTPDGGHCISGGIDDTLRAWDLASGDLRGMVTGLHSPVQGLAMGGDPARLLTAHRDGRCRLWRLPLGATRESRATGKGPLWAVALAADGSLGLCASHAGPLLPWTFDAAAVPVFEGHRGPTWAIAFVPDGLRVVSGGDDGTVRLWDRTTARLLSTMSGHAGAVFALAVTPDGRQILSGSADRTLRLWDRDTGQTVHPFVGHTDAVYAVGISPNGRYALSAGCDGTVRVWHLATGRLLRTLTEHRGRVLALTIAPDGRTVVTAGDDALIRLWRFPPGLLTDAGPGVG